MWLVRKTSGEPVFFQCAVLPLEDYPMSSRAVTYDASALPASTAGEAPALEAQAAPTGVNTLLEQPPATADEAEAEAVEEKVPVTANGGAAGMPPAAAAATAAVGGEAAAVQGAGTE